MHRLLAALALSLLAGCASDAKDYPSLARRPVERAWAQGPAAAPPPAAPATIPGASAGQLDSLVARARAADARFHDREARARSLVGAAAGAAAGTESWSVAAIALSELQSARSDTITALADLDALYAAARVAAADARAIETARETVAAMARDEDSVVAQLAGQLD